MAIPQNISRELAKVAEYVRYLASHLRLSEWSFSIEGNAELRDALACIQIVPHRQFAVIGLSDYYFDSSPKDQRHALVHELVHCHLEPIRNTAETCMSAMANHTFEVFRQNHDNSVESVTDRLATAISAGLPTPDKWKKGRTK